MGTTTPGAVFQWANELATRGNNAADQAQKAALERNPQDAVGGVKAGIKAFVDTITQANIGKAVMDQGLAFASSILAVFFTAITKFRESEAQNFDQAIAAILSEFLAVDFDASQLATTTAGGASSSPGDISLQKARAIGKLVLGRLEQEFTGGAAVTMDTGETGAQTFAGFGVNFGIQNALISLLGACVPETRLEDLRELGVEVAQNIGLGRLVRQALRPLVQETISTPYTRKLKRKYQQDLLGLGELVRARLRNPDDDDTWFEFLRQHGLSDPQIAELTAQHLPRLNAQEQDTLTAIGGAPQGDDFYELKSSGTPPEVAAARLSVHQYRRLERARERALQAVLSEVSNGFLDPTALEKVFTDIALPADEQTAWRVAAGYLYERTRKRIGMSEMLFLYEAAQITLSDVANWSAAEGYSPDDQQRLQLYFELKATEAANKGGSNSAAKVAARHAEHIAYMTDEIGGLWNRPPTQPELDYWVPLLDVGARTKADVKAELKALDTSGPAIPA